MISAESLFDVYNLLLSDGTLPTSSLTLLLFSSFLIPLDSSVAQGRRDFYASVVLSSLLHMAEAAKTFPARLSPLLEKLQTIAEQRNNDADRAVEIFHQDVPRPYLPWVIASEVDFFRHEFVIVLSHCQHLNSSIAIQVGLNACRNLFIEALPQPWKLFSDELARVRDASLDISALELPPPAPLNASDSLVYPNPRNVFSLFEGGSYSFASLHCPILTDSLLIVFFSETSALGRSSPLTR